MRFGLGKPAMGEQLYLSSFVQRVNQKHVELQLDGDQIEQNVGRRSQFGGLDELFGRPRPQRRPVSRGMQLVNICRRVGHDGASGMPESRHCQRQCITNALNPDIFPHPPSS